MSNIRCPTCNRFGSIALGGYCSACVPKDHWKDVPHLGDNQLKSNTYWKGPFIPKSYSIIKKKVDIVHGESR